jgi:putative ABC transport system permease protein
MLQHSFLLIYRSFKRFKNSFFINLIGLSTGLACTLLIYLWVQDEINFDKFHENDSRLYQVMENQKGGDSDLVRYRTSGLVAETLKDEIPEIEYAVPVIQSSWFPKFILSTDGDDKHKAIGQFVGEDYFNVFSFGLISGGFDKVLQDKNSIVISDELALKIFKTTENVIGKPIALQLAHLKIPVIVSGIFTKVPMNSSEEFDFLLSFESFKDISPAVLDWGNNGTNTYITVNRGTDISLLNSKISGLIKSKIPNTDRSLFLKAYSEAYLYGKYENGVQAGGRIEYVNLFSVVAIFILIIASINFMNLSTAKASRRIKEVGIKKAIGASRKTLILQYMGESMMMSFLSLAIAVVIVELLLPQFNLIAGKQLALTLDLKIISAFTGITLFTGLISGSYPALYLSGFNPAVVLKGKINTSVGELFVRKGLVVFQYAVSVILIVAVLVVYKQIEYVQDKNLGYNKDNIIYFENEGTLPNNLGAFLTELRNVPGVNRASSMFGNLIGGYSSTGDVSWAGKNPDDRKAFEIIDANYDLLEMLEIELTAGRNFSEEFGADTAKVIFNQAAIDVMGLSDPVGEMVNIWGVDLEVIGVAANFHFQSLHENVKPLFIRLDPGNASIIMAKIEAGTEKETIALLQDFYKIHNPGYSFDYKFLDEDFQAQYVSETRVASLSQGFAGLAILISSLGLFGLSAFSAERRVKEIGIRKVLGASEMGVVYLLSSEFTKIVLVAILIALPISYFMVASWLEGFAYKIELSWWYFTVAGLVAMLIAWLTVGTQAIKAAKNNAVSSLRSE